jgi:hypothetical protein
VTNDYSLLIVQLVGSSTVSYLEAVWQQNCAVDSAPRLWLDQQGNYGYILQNIRTVSEVYLLPY